MIGSVLSEATLLKFVWRLHQSLETWEAKAIDSILQAPSIHVDETSFRVKKKNHWIHVYSSGETTLKLLHRKRGKEAIVDLNIIPRYGGVIFHDCWASYLLYDHCGHGLCGSHLLRELVFIVDSNQYRWAGNIKRLLQETCHITNNRAERDLRMAKVKQKISGCFRRNRYAQAYCRISSYLQTMANQGVNPLVAIQLALAGKITPSKIDRGE